MVILPFGHAALLAEVASLAEVLELERGLSVSVPEGVIDLVPAARTVLVTFDPTRITAVRVRTWLEHGADAGSTPADPPATVTIATRYDGPDLEDVARQLGLSAEALVAAHQRAVWTVAFTGFAPGFGYLTSPDWRFEVARHESPRTRVPAGAVALAGEFSAAYPRATPGGWQLIGTTDAALFDPAADEPALLAPGVRVRFVPAARPVAVLPAEGKATAEATVGHAAGAPAASAALRVIEPGPLSTVQDLGRPGQASLGVAPSGALDQAALRIANRLLGNLEGAAAIEVTMGGLRVVAERDLWFAVTGAWGPIRVDGRMFDPYQAHPWRAGSELRIDTFERGVRGYLAIRGGIEAPRVLGSASTDLLAGLGPARLAAGDLIDAGPAPREPMPALAFTPWGPPEDELLDIALAAGPRVDWFDEEAVAALFSAEWTVSADADRVGIRLQGPALMRSREGELPSEGMVPGALQVPPDGRPVILGRDGPVTGGYPVIAVVVAESVDRLGQARPGTRIRFRHAGPGG